MEGDTFALDCICFDFIQIWLKYAQNRYSLFIYQTGEGVPPTIIHLAEHNGSYANAKVLTLCGRFLFNIHHSLNSNLAQLN